MSRTATATATARTATANARSVSPDRHGSIVDAKSLVLLAVLLAAGFILSMTVGNALAVVGIKPQFTIAAYVLAILLTRASLPAALAYGVITAAVIQLTASIPGLNFATEPVAALACAALARLDLKIGGRNVTPFLAALVTTLVSGGLFATLGTLVSGAAAATILVKLPTVLSVSIFNAVVVQALYFPMRAALKR